jgi:hypothetical protein
MTNLPRHPLISLEIQASSICPSLQSPKVSPSNLRRGGKFSTKESTSSPKPCHPATSVTYSVALLSSAPWLPLSASLSSLNVKCRAKVLEELDERAHSIICLGPTHCDGCFDDSGPTEPETTVADKPPFESRCTPFAILYCVWKPGVSAAAMYSQIATSWSRLQNVTGRHEAHWTNSETSTTCDNGSDPTAFNTESHHTSSMASNDDSACESTAPPVSFQPTLVDESDETKQEDENSILEGDSRRGERHDAQCSVYLVIDQVLAYGISHGGGGVDCEAKVLAKALATNGEVRSLCQGISICVSCAQPPSSDSVAAELLALSSPENVVLPASPGLELVCQALRLGESQRKLHTEREGDVNHSPEAVSSPKSIISVIVTEPSVLDTQENACIAEEPDSSAFIDDDDAESMSPPSQVSPCPSTVHHAHCHRPVTVVVEWNGQGNLFAFAQRAHAAWRRSVGWPPEAKPRPPPRKIPRRIRRLRPLVASPPSTPMHVLPINQESSMSAYTETSKLRRLEELRQDLVAAVVIMCYLWFHFAEDCSTILWLLLAPSGHAEIAQYLREWR